MRRDFDVVVVGGGIVGAATAALLAAQSELAHLSLALIEAQPPSAPPEGDIDLRVSALSRASERVLRAVGAWQDAVALHASPYEEMVVWDAATRIGSPAVLHFAASATGEPNLGYIVENRRVLWSLYGAPAMRERVSVQRAELSALEFTEGVTRLTLSDGRRLTAGLVVGADGASSRSRELAQLQIDQRPYRQSAVVTHVRTEQPHRSTAYQRFLPQGPIALLPLVDGRSSIVWTTTPEHAACLVSMPEAECAMAIRAASDGVLGDVEIAAPRAHFPLRLIHARAYCRMGFVLVGDAAHTVHPLAGQGVNMGLLDAAALVEVLRASVREHGAMAVGDMVALRRYERWRKSDNALAIGLIDGLNSLFSNDNAALKFLRRSGFALVNRSRLAKQILITRALGIGGHVPDIVRQPT
jgi:2-octaprenylphenol hydroxylase